MPRPSFVSMQDWGGHAPPENCLEIRCSEIASEAIFKQKQSCCSYIAHGVLHPIFDCPCMHAFAKPDDFKFPREKVLQLSEQ